jgi:hypothetical protein
MLHFKPALGASVLALLATAPAAFADVSAADVWGQWKDYLSRSGQTVTVGGEQMAGDTLTVSDVKMALDSPEMGYSATIPTLSFKENGDGTVSVTMAEEYPVQLDIRPKNDDPVKVSLAVRQTGLAMTASGTPDAISYVYSADQVAVDIDEVMAQGAPDTTVAGGLKISGLTGTYDLGAGALQAFASGLKAASLGFDLDVKAPSENGAMKLSLNATDITGTSEGAMPSGIDYADMAAAIAAGFVAKGGLGYGAANYDLTFQDGSDSFQANATMDSGALDFAMSASGLSYMTSAKGLEANISGSDMPLPVINLKMEESAFGLTMPIAKSDTPQDVGLVVRMVGLVVQEDIWGMIDPGGQLPHDPATLILDLKGTANWLVDIMSPDAEAQMSAGMPGQLHTLDINELELTAIGASLTGTGGFVFDNDDLMTWGGMPAPDGAIDLKLVGANALIDKLVGMGLIPQDQAMMAKMSMGMFAKPGDGPDTLTSKIEVTKDGHIFANGQQLQ